MKTDPEMPIFTSHLFWTRCYGDIGDPRGLLFLLFRTPPPRSDRSVSNAPDVLNAGTEFQFEGG